MYSNNDSDATAEAFRLLATLYMYEPDSTLVENFQESFQTEFNASMADIVDDFHELFYSSDQHMTPLESSYVHVSDSPVGSDSGTERVYSFYLQEGLILDEDINMIPDHIAAELFFISYLIETNRMDSLKEFLQQHAVQWIPQFCDELYEFAATDFYKELAAVTKDALLTQYEALSG